MNQVPFNKNQMACHFPKTRSRRRRWRDSVSALVLAMVALPSSALAQEWTGVVSSDWNTAGNWNTGVLPTAATPVVIDTVSPHPTSISGVAVANALDLGSTGAGSLAIQSGGVLGTGFVRLGVANGALGTLTVNGELSSAAEIHVGVSGEGVLTISGGGIVTNTDGIVGAIAGSDGRVTVNGTGSAWTNTGVLGVGNAGDGSLSILNGGAVQASDIGIASGVGSTGRVAVEGAGSALATAGTLNVGYYGDGTLIVADGGVVSSGAAEIGAMIGSSGSVRLDGSGSSWTLGGDLVVGGRGSGEVVVSGGAVLDTTGYLSTLGGDTLGQGIVTLDGGVWNAGNLHIGDYGSGRLDIFGGGMLNAGNEIVLGYNSPGGGLINLSGSGSQIVADSLSIGADGSGTVEIAEGASAVISNSVIVGEKGTGVLTIASGATLQSGHGTIGSIAGSQGEVLVTGAGSTWDAIGNNIYVGDSGVGGLTIRNGGSVLSVHLQLGTTATGQGTILVDGANSSLTLESFGILTVGFHGTADITVSGGGTISANGVDLATDTSASANVLVTGQGSTLEAGGSVNIGVVGTGVLTVADGATVKASNIIVANAGGGNGTLNIGTGGAAGILDTPTVAFGAGDGTINFNHTETSYSFDAAVSGTGTVNVLSGHTVFTANSTYTGLTTVSGGKLSVDGSILSHVAVTGGTLGGSGTVQSIAVGNGIVAPGNSIGTLTVAGNATFNSGSVFQVEVDSAGNSDLLDVGGFASLAGTVQVLPYPDYALGTTYTILTSANGLMGTTFDDAIFGGGSIFVTPTLSYDANNVYVALAQTAIFGDVALTPNQKAAASGADSLGAGNDIYDAILLLTDADAARAAFDALSGEIHMSAQTALVEDSRFTREAALGRLRSAFDAAGAEGVATREISENLSVWGQGFGSWGSFDSDGNAATMSRDIGGLFFGADALVGEAFRLGFMGGYSQTAFSAGDRSSSGSADSYTLGIYGGGQWDYAGGEIALRGGAAFGWHDMDVNRRVTFDGFSDSLSSSYDARTMQAFAEAAYGFDRGEVRYEPFVNLAHVNVRADEFTESGGAAALDVAGQAIDTTFATLGIRGEKSVGFGDIGGRVRGVIGYRHAFGETVPTSDLAFVSGGSVFTVAGVPVASGAVVFDAALDLDLSPTATLALSYGGQVGSDVADHGLKASLNVKF